VVEACVSLLRFSPWKSRSPPAFAGAGYCVQEPAARRYLLGLSLIVSNRMMAGLERLIEGTRRMQDGDGYEVLPVTSKDEIGKLTIAFNQMVEDLRAKDRIKETFGKFVDPRIVANLIDPAGGNDLAERQVATVFFSDIKGFSGLGELLTATTLVKLLNTYFSEMTTLIHARNGIIDKLIGDGLMAFWTAPFSRGREPRHRRLSGRIGAAGRDPEAEGTLIRNPWAAPRPA
jgi:HAMP domain-containing protein